MKSELSKLALIVAVAISTVFADDANEQQQFSNAQRFATMALNIVPGLGSALIMNDYLGAGVQLYLTALGMTFIGFEGGVIDTKKDSNGDSYLEYPGLVYIGATVLVANAAFNIFRSMYYNEPAKSANHATANQPNGFNLSVLPNRRGEAMPYVMYNRNF